ncbi:MAG: ATP-dependent Clp protease ATP-binding subunit, partial [Deltaproteobacteria bacterium]|nr:ATP-dependent Clp protease ATP-binding subunit [Deltaproteobacteria bacterium]
MVDDSRFSREARQVLAEAGDIAKRAGKKLDSSHLVLAIFTVPCEAQSILIEKRLVVDQILDCLPIPDAEAYETIGVIYSTAAQICANLGSRQVTSVHILMAVSRITSSHAARVLEKAGLPMFALRTHAMAHLTDPRLKRAATERLIATGSNGIDGAAPVLLMGAGPRRSRLRSEDGFMHSAGVASNKALIDDDQEPVEFNLTDQPAQGPAHERDASPAPKADRPANQASAEVGEGFRFALDPEEFPTLVSLGRNLTLEAEQGLIDPLIGRRKDLERVVDILCKRRANNPLLLGDPGVGKTALVEGLASLIVGGDKDLPNGLDGKVIVGLSVADMLA